MSKESLDELVYYQVLLGELGFTISGDGSYYKDYGLLDGSILRLVPNFDTGISLDSKFRLSAITINSSKTVPILEGGQTRLNEFPRECMGDVMQMMATMAPQSRMPLQETFIITEHCTMCGDKVSSFFKKQEETLCLDCL